MSLPFPRVSHAIILAALALPISACSEPMKLAAHLTEGNVLFHGTLARYPTGEGALNFAAPGGPSCNGIVVPSTERTPERLEGQIQCNDGRSGAIRMTLTRRMGVGSGLLGRDRITFRVFQKAAERSSAVNALRTGQVTLDELREDLLGQP